MGRSVSGRSQDRDLDKNPLTHLVQRFEASDWEMQGEFAVMHTAIEDAPEHFYIRVRGTNTQETEPTPDPQGEDPWSDLWFYSNPAFVKSQK